jgi:serine/threonine protein kinase
MDHPQELIGKKIGKCIVERPLAKGGFGFSYIGFDSELEKKRVIKVSQASSGSEVTSSYDLECFKREGHILARLKHPQIVSLTEQGEAFGYRYMIIEYIDGFDFSRVLRILRNKREEMSCRWSDLLDPVTALGLLASALEPLQYAHKAKISLPGEEAVQGLAHRDISTGNLMLGSGHEYQGQVYLIDFGTAKSNFNLSSTLDMAVVGSIKYMSPMRLMKKTHEALQSSCWEGFRQTQFDVHSMGCFLWELLTGGPHIIIRDNDLAQAVAEIQNPETYRELFANTRIYDRDIQSLIRKSVVLPDLKTNRTPFQYRDASEMLKDVYDVYYRMSGRAPVHQVLAQFSREIQDPSLLDVHSRPASGRIARFSKTGKIQSGFRTRSRSRSLTLATVLLLVILTGIIAWYAGYRSRTTVEPVQEEPQPALEQAQEEEAIEVQPEPGPAPEASAPIAALHKEKEVKDTTPKPSAEPPPEKTPEKTGAVLNARPCC